LLEVHEASSPTILSFKESGQARCAEIAVYGNGLGVKVPMSLYFGKFTINNIKCIDDNKLVKI